MPRFFGFSEPQSVSSSAPLARVARVARGTLIALVATGAIVSACANGNAEGVNGFGGGTADGAAGTPDQDGSIATGDSGSIVDGNVLGDTGSSGDTGANGNDAGDANADAAPGGNPVGFPCANGAGCISGLCKPVVAGSGGNVCVTACTQQTDCDDNFFCDPETPGATNGFCVPHSPTHCATCASSSECGGLSERCGVAAGEPAKACHVDCTISGNAACPADYSCVSTTLDGTAAMVCRPNGALTCLDALGGFCDRVATPQPCARTNAAGACVGQRQCLTASQRYGSCGAVAPVCKATCSATDPAGCTTNFCPEATQDPAHCGSCTNPCPGYQQANADVSCNLPSTCTFACQGETYDIDGSKANGCEVSDSPTGNHDSNGAVSLGDIGCHDDSSDPNISGKLPSDSEPHANPVIGGFSTTSGSAPDYYTIHGVGGSTFNPCVDNIDLTLKMIGSVHPSCYHMHIETDKFPGSSGLDCDTTAAGTCTINPGGSGNYSDGTTLTLVVSKRGIAGCTSGARDNPTYTVKGHL